MRAAQAGKGQEVVDELRHALGVGAHAFQVVPAVLVEPFVVVVQQRLAEPDPLGDRRPAIVGQDVAHAVWFLASRYADYITGEILHVDGGFKME